MPSGSRLAGLLWSPSVAAGLAGFAALAVVSLRAATALRLYPRHWCVWPVEAGLASPQRNRYGARSNARKDGRRLRHLRAWHRGGHLGYVVFAPTGVAFTIETKTRALAPSHMAKWPWLHARWPAHERLKPRHSEPKNATKT